jgi:hypothetical protein
VSEYNGSVSELVWKNTTSNSFTYTHTYAVLTLHDSVHGTRLLAVAAVDALGHINVVTSGAAGTIRALFGLYSDGLCE